MYCPSCRAEYRAGFDRCADCGVPLVAELAPERNPPREIELVRVFESSNPALVAMAKSLLEAAEIEYVKSGEGTQLELDAIPVRIQVLKEVAAEAAALLEDLESSRVVSEEEPDGLED